MTPNMNVNQVFTTYLNVSLVSILVLRLHSIRGNYRRADPKACHFYNFSSAQEIKYKITDKN